MTDTLTRKRSRHDVTPTMAPEPEPVTPHITPQHRSTTMPLSRLAVSGLNVRKHGGVMPKACFQHDTTDTLAASIRAQGLLQPLIVRADGNGYAVLAGRRRLKALQLIARETGDDPDVPVMVIDGEDDATAIAASLAENIERLPMDELDQYTAFAALIRNGQGEADIAGSFGITVQTVRRRLALAKLIPDIHRLYRAGEIDSDTLKLLTLAPRERQKAFVAAMRDPDSEPLPPRWQLKAWLLGGAEIETRHALFDEANYKGDITGDLFGDRRYFLDGEQFWRLQNEAIAALKHELGCKGWQDVTVIGPAEAFYPHQWTQAKKDDGGGVVIAVAPSGAVEVHKGLITVAEAGKRRAAALKSRHPTRKGETAPAGEGADANDHEGEADDAPTGRPEMTQPLANYCDLVRLAAVRVELLAHPKTALRLLVAHLLGRAGNIRATAEPATPKTDAAREAFLAHPATAAMEDARKAARKVLKLDGEDEPGASIIGPPFGPDRTAHVFDALLALDDKTVMAIAALVMAETLSPGTAIVDAAGAMLETRTLDHWQPDTAFLDLVRDREAAGAMLDEVIGTKAAAAYTTDTARAKKEVIANALAGKNRQQVTGWCPRWLAFPQGQYTTRPRTGHPSPTS